MDVEAAQADMVRKHIIAIAYLINISIFVADK